jgi:hypothetical protein
MPHAPSFAKRSAWRPPMSDISSRSRLPAVLAAVVLLAGCQLYWSKPGADLTAFSADHRECTTKAAVPMRDDQVLVNLDVYRACLKALGWSRETGGKFGMPGGYRGLEDEGPIRLGDPPRQIGGVPVMPSMQPAGPPGPNAPWIVGSWIGAVDMRGMTDNVTRFEFQDGSGGIVWRMTGRYMFGGQFWRSWASGRVVASSDGHVDLDGKFDGSEPPRLAGARLRLTLRRTSEGAEGEGIGYLQQVFPIRLRRE